VRLAGRDLDHLKALERRYPALGPGLGQPSVGVPKAVALEQLQRFGEEVMRPSPARRSRKIAPGCCATRQRVRHAMSSWARAALGLRARLARPTFRTWMPVMGLLSRRHRMIAVSLRHFFRSAGTARRRLHDGPHVAD